MQIDRRITNGLAWAGVVLVIGIPVADVVSAQFMAERTPSAQVAALAPEPAAPAPVAPQPATRPVAEIAAKPTPVAPVTPAKPATPAVVATTAKSGDVVDGYLSTGKPLPSYITGGDSAAPRAQEKAPAEAQLVIDAEIDPIDVAALPPARVAPMPMPLSMRPEPRSTATVTYTNNAPQVVIPASVTPPAAVTARDLEDWESGPLSEFLAKRQAAGQVDPGYDPDGFFLDEGPNRARQRDRLIGPADEFYFPFAN
ncbi:hypothetical protein [Devosia neptuniae]|jgi:hypothetical protein|uniref:hypothetical protein n=1 Tax=Devosia TaxID=46913 RepID=UPI0022AE63DF|nr:hypothetical protein [Devosia neptuniae]MCZ4345761.1 hypothetical protein [Devosia neptuniae]|tara:strand:+ start:61009 stop:61773 length:765 start_codon:yes stop_codon:yes gene_type:complete